MNPNNLFKLQEVLDERIREQHNLVGTSLLSKKLLALQVELGELANETRCFKFWSDKKPSSKEIILEEYVDCLHFILTLGLDMKYSDIIEINGKKVNSEITEQFLNLFIDSNDFLVCSSRDHYITLFEDFLSLGFSLGFTEEDITKGYIKKNDINHQRQDEGY